jgi:hypothetical protein
VLHSFPTRRSSDLERSRESRLPTIDEAPEGDTVEQEVTRPKRDNRRVPQRFKDYTCSRVTLDDEGGDGARDAVCDRTMDDTDSVQHRIEPSDVVRWIEGIENRLLKIQSSDTVPQSQSAKAKPIVLEMVRYTASIVKAGDKDQHPRKIDTSDRSVEETERNANRSQRRQENRSEGEVRDAEDKGQRTKSRSPDRPKGTGRRSNTDGDYLVNATNPRPCRSSEEPRLCRDYQDQYEPSGFRHAYSDYETQQSSSARSPRGRAMYRERHSERFGVRQPQDKDPRDLWLPPPSTYFSRQQPSVDPIWSRHSTVGRTAESYRSRSPGGRRQQSQAE